MVNFYELYERIKGSGEVLLLTENMKEIERVKRERLLNWSGDAFCGICDFDVTQEIVDVAQKKGIKVLIGKRIRDLDFVPQNLELHSLKYIKPERIKVLGYKGPLSQKAIDYLEKFGYECEFVDLSENPEYFESHELKALPALLHQDEIIFEGIPSEREIKTLFQKDEDLKLASKLIIELERNPKLEDSDGAKKYLNEAKIAFNEGRHDKAIDLCRKAEDAFSEVFESYCPKCGAYLEEEICPRCGFAGEPSVEEIEVLYLRCSELKEKLEVLERRFRSGEVSGETYEILKDRVTSELKRVDSELRALGSPGCLQ
ncbi:MAG: hypothetical protein ACE5K0_07370 [Candidatus Methanofastidiosia archaeon]